MNSRERFHATMRYGAVDRPWSWEMGPYPATVDRWLREGLRSRADVPHIGRYDRLEHAGVNFWHDPPFEVTVLEETAEHTVYQDTDGVVKEKTKTAGAGSSFPAMPRYRSFPVTDRASWRRFRQERLDPESPTRFDYHFGDRLADWQTRTYPLRAAYVTLFGLLRNWIGMENLALLLHDDPAFIEECAADMAAYQTRLLERMLAGVQPDWIEFWEDMAYKTGSLIDPRVYRRIFVPHYRRMIEVIRRHAPEDRTVLVLDSDGHIDELIPVWLDMGIDAVLPMEVAAGMDVARLRSRFGRLLRMFGGIDKRVLATGGKAEIEAMIRQVAGVVRDGGYVPGCDHNIPEDVPFENYRYYRQLIRALD
jgi:uroporphyrinogen decarboxylase